MTDQMGIGIGRVERIPSDHWHMLKQDNQAQPFSIDLVLLRSNCAKERAAANIDLCWWSMVPLLPIHHG